jgi:uncharacterized membrane protein
MTLAVYALFGVAALIALLARGSSPVAPLGGIAPLWGIVAIILAYVKRGDAAGTWLASHYRWLIRTYWFSVLWYLIGFLLLVLMLASLGWIVNLAIWIGTSIWVLYRLIRGYVLFRESRPIPGM